MDNNNMGETASNENENGQESGYSSPAYTPPVYEQPEYDQTIYNQPVYSQQESQESSNLEEPVSMGEWIVTFLLMLIPCANIILMFVWAFSKTEKKSKSNFFKAYLIAGAVYLAFIAIIFVIVFVAAAAIAAAA